MNTYINAYQINRLVNTAEDSKEKIDEILKKALTLKGLNLEEVATLINIKDKDMTKKLFDTALFIKNKIYGTRLVMFAPLYVSNNCSNNCLYCGFRKDNRDIHRKTLTIDEIKNETKYILTQGHKRVLMLMGEDSNCSFDYFIDSINAVYSVKDYKDNSIRRINIEIAPLTDDEFKKLNKVKIGTYTVFQETYHEETYNKVHPSGKKSDYSWRLNTMDRALANDIHDVGIGALFGLYDYRFEVLALIKHSKYLEKKFGVGPHTISIPTS
jgi:2-iminoacetate synthase